MKLELFTFLISIILATNAVCASLWPRVDKDIAIYDQNVAKIKVDFSSQPADPKNKTWVKEKLIIWSKLTSI